jgi:predicted Rossmann-fold nucleotide-binding protein
LPESLLITTICASTGEPASSVGPLHRVAFLVDNPAGQGARESYAEAATTLARYLAANGIGIVYGGGKRGLMAELADAFIALPGGYGAFEEFCEILTWTQLGLQRKACGILNIAGYYDPLLSLFDRAVKEQFLNSVHREIVLSDSCPERLVKRLLEYAPPQVDKWIDLKQT